MSKTQILYKDIAVGAAEDAAISSTGAAAFSDPTKLPTGVTPVKIATGELNAWALDGTYEIMDDQDIAFWSSALSNASCSLSPYPVITIQFDQQYSSVGLTLVFNEATGEYCKSVNIQWYRGETIKASKDFSPNAASFFCQQEVSSYNKVVITIKQTNLPYRYAKLTQILFGVYRYFGMEELRGVAAINEINALAQELPVSTMKWTLDSKTDVNFMFQLKQPVEVRNADKLVGVYYIDGYKRVAANVYDINCYDAIGVLCESPFTGAFYTNKSAKTLMQEIAGTDFVVEFDDGVADLNLTGAILDCTRREAMQQVLFAWGKCAATDGRSSIRVFTLGSTAAEVPEQRTFSGVSVETTAIVTKVFVTAHTYAQDTNGSVELGGIKYSDTKTVYTVENPDVTATDKQNVVEITGGTLVSTAIGRAVAQLVYDHYAKRSTSKARVVWNGERLGDCIGLHNAWGGTNTGSLVKMEIKVSNTIVAGCETKGA